MGDAASRRLHGRQESSVARLRTLTRLTHLITSSLDLDQVLREIVRAAAALMDARSASFALVNEAAKTIEHRAWSDDRVGGDFPQQILKFGEGLLGWIAIHRQRVNVADITADERVGNPGWLASHGLTSYLGVPVSTDGSLIAILSLNSDKPFVLTSEDEDLLETFAAQAAIAIRNARLFAESSRRRRSAEAVAALGRALSETLDPELVAQQTVESARTLLGVRNAALYRLDKAGTLTSIAVSGDLGPAFGKNVVFPSGMGMIGIALREQRPVTTTNVLTDERIVLTADLRSRIERAGYRSVLSVPLAVKDRVIGALSVGDVLGRVFDEDEVRAIQTFAAQAALALENARLYEEAERQRRETELSAEIVHAIGASLDLDTVLRRITHGAKDLVGSDTALIGLREVDRGVVTGLYRAGPPLAADRTLTIEPGKGIGGQALLTGRPYRTDDYVNDPRLTKDYAEVVREDRAVAVMVVPIKVDEGIVGVLYVANRSPRSFTDRDEAVLLRLAEGAAMAIKNAQLYARERESEQRYRTLVDGSIQSVAIVRDWVTLFTNSILATTLGYASPRDLLGLDARCWIAPHHVERVEAYVAALEREESVPAGFEFQALKRDGTLIWAEIQMSSVTWGGGPAVQITGFDITERKRAEQALRESSEFQKQVITSAREGIVVYDRALRYVVWNPLMEELTGVPAVDVVGRHCLDVFPFLREQGVYALFGRALQGEMVSSPDFRYTVPASGRTGWVSGRYGPLRDADGQIIGVIATVRDVTERRRAEEALRESEAQLRQAHKMEAVGRLAGGIAHDFNNLLMVIMGRGELLLRRLRPDDPVRADLEQIKKTADRATQLTRQLLAFSRKQMLQPKVINLNSLVTGVAQMLQRLIGEDLDLVTLLDPNLGVVHADPAQIEQIVVNLTVNARDAIPEGGRISLKTANIDLDEVFVAAHPGASVGPHALLEVCDTGVGMSTEVQAHIFEPFFTTKDVGKGTGLGLATVYGIVKQHEGYIDVESTPGVGSAFRIYLKRVNEVAHPTEAAVRAPRVATSSEIVLLVEDQDDVRELAREILAADGYRVLAASAPGEALDLARRHGGPIHLLLTDVVMPQMSGRVLAERLTPEHPEMRVLYMSGYTDDAIGRHGVLEPGTRLLQKPFSPDVLSREVREVLAS